MTYEECFQSGKAVLERAGVQEAALDARLLLEYVCDTDRNTLLAHGEKEVLDSQAGAYESLIEKRARRIPLQHLTGVQEFMGLVFAVNEHVLIPRQDTEILVEEVLRELSDGSRILDMCTGSGCILISLLHFSNHCQGMGVDISGEALRTAEENAVRNGLFLEKAPWEEWGDSQDLCGQEKAGICFLQSDLFASVKGKFEVIVSNPPYIPSAVLDTLMPEVREHEPRLALDGHEDGLYFYRKIISDSREHLTGGGRLFLEIGYDQGEAVKSLMEQKGFKDIVIVKDYGGLDRVVSGTLS